jgi:DNA-directed RNA polymerase subunit RPC12/RpoP
VLRLKRYTYRCGQCRRHYDLPGADLSFFYGWFLGISRNLETVAFEVIAYPGLDEIEAILDLIAGELGIPRPTDWLGQSLTAVCDPDSQGERFIFARTPGCPNCGSTRVREFFGTEEWWPEPAGPPTHQIWESLDRPAKIRAIRDALGLSEPAG